MAIGAQPADRVPGQHAGEAAHDERLFAHRTALDEALGPGA